VLPPGSYFVHVPPSGCQRVQPVNLKATTDRESFLLAAGGLRIEGRCPLVPRIRRQISFLSSKAASSRFGERAPRCRR